MLSFYAFVVSADVIYVLCRLLVQLVFNSSVFLDKFLVLMEREGAAFISVIFIFLLTIYMIFATLKGIFFVS